MDDIESTVTHFIPPPENENNHLGKTESLRQTEIVKEGLLLCRTCLRFYPITDEIPIILPDELRDKNKDLEYIRNWRQQIPTHLLPNLKPWTS